MGLSAGVRTAAGEEENDMTSPRLDHAVNSQWARVRGILRSEVGDASYRSWLKPLTLVDVSDGRVRISVPTRFMRDWVLSHYGDRLRALWQQENGAVEDLEVFVHAASQKPIVRETGVSASAAVPRPVREAETAPATAAAGIDEISAPLDPRFTFDNFIVGKPNELAYAAARRVADSESAAFNPLFLYGGVGLGKTHLMHAIALHTRQRFPGRRVVYLSAEKFMYHFVRAIRFHNTLAFKDLFRSVDLLMIDDVQFMDARKESTQDEFFHTFNDLVDNNRQVVISADKSPSDLELEERLRSRLGWGLVADIHATNYELRLGILDAKAERLGIDIPTKVKEFLAHRITSNVRELEGALNRVVAHATLVGREITLETCQEVLHDLLRANDRRVTIEEIQKRVAEHFNVRIADMHSARRARAVARPRQVAMYLAKQLTSRSLPEIGRKFGGRDHTTVMHAVKRIEELRQTDSGFCDDVDLLRRMLES
jgi:chromosomal replication initiator protein